jgi:mannose/fructose/sorbose-specific phosphotransferase system IIA component
MIGLLLLSHGNLCEYMLKSTAMVAGDIKQSRVVPLNPGEAPQDYEARVRAAIAEVDTGEGVIALVDVLGGTPYNTVGSLSRDCNMQIVTGMNMPMVVYFTFERENGHTMEELVDSAYEAAKEGIQILRRK